MSSGNNARKGNSNRMTRNLLQTKWAAEESRGSDTPPDYPGYPEAFSDSHRSKKRKYYKPNPHLQLSPEALHRRHERSLHRSGRNRSESFSRDRKGPSQLKINLPDVSALQNDEITQRTKKSPFSSARKINLDPVSFSNHNHQSFSATDTDARYHQISSSRFSSKERFHSDIDSPTFNLPPLFAPPSSSHHPVHFPTHYGSPSAPPPPEFDSTTPTNISAQHGSNTFLICRIRNLSNQSVSCAVRDYVLWCEIALSF